jgi:hypothetical protein
MLRKAPRHFLAFALLSLPSLSWGSETVISTDNGTVGCCYAILNMFTAEAGWSQTGTFDDVTITAEIDPGTGSGLTGTAYLMSSIGPGTTTIDQIDTATFTASGAAFTAQLNTLFTGLTLGPGNYYLVLSSPGGLGWEGNDPGITPVTGPGVTFLSAESTSPNSPAVYPPAGDFSSTLGNIPEFTVTAVSSVPEPSGIAFLCAAMLGLGVKRRFLP